MTGDADRRAARDRRSGELDRRAGARRAARGTPAPTPTPTPTPRERDADPLSRVIDRIVARLRELRAAHPGVDDAALDRETMAEVSAGFERLVAESRHKDEFLAMLGHELRNPLSAIVMATELLALEHPHASSQAGWALGVINRQAGQLGRLVDDLLDVSRLAHGKIALCLEPHDLRALIEDALASIQARAADKRIELTCALPPRALTASCDGARVRQIVVNLLDNAVKYTPAGGHVVVSLRATTGGARLSVKDNGVGMTAEHLARAFELFEQHGGISGPSDAGLGLGLALVRQLVELHDGKVVAHSAGRGRGCELIVDLPRKPRPGRAAATGAKADAIDAPPDGSADGGGDRASTRLLHVLVADDDRDIVQMLDIGLSTLGHKVVSASDGAAALDRVRRDEACDLAIVDLAMPGMDGFELARQLRARFPAVVIIALTGFGDAHHRARALRASVNHYLVKPVDVRALRRLVRTYEDVPGRAPR
jgi:signal transduction histidine kinase/ActR/RegA family two-component response regulator